MDGQLAKAPLSHVTSAAVGIVVGQVQEDDALVAPRSSAV